MCPFGRQPVLGTCKPIFDQVLNLPVEMWYGLTVIWSRSDYSMAADSQTLSALGRIILNGFTDYFDERHYEHHCNACQMTVTMISNVSASNFKNASSYMYTNQSNGDVYPNRNKSVSQPSFILLIYQTTTATCQLEEIYDQVSDLSGKILPADINGETAMYLKYNVFNEKEVRMSMEVQLKSVGIPDCNPVSAYFIRGEKLCPKIRIKYSEFSEYLSEENWGAIEALFTNKNTATDICLDDYYQKLEYVDVKVPTSGDIQFSGDIPLCMAALVVPTVVFFVE